MEKRVIFDMDGTLVDTEWVVSETWRCLLVACGVTPTLNKSGTYHWPGKPTYIQVGLVKEKYKIPDIPTALLDKRRAAQQGLLASGRVIEMPGASELLSSLNSLNVTMALASGSSPENISTMFQQFGWKGYFSATVSVKEVGREKPAPDVYLEAARRLGLAPESCVAIEDSETGVASAKAAKMKVIAVPNKITAADDFSPADLVVKSLPEITWSIISTI